MDFLVGGHYYSLFFLHNDTYVSSYISYTTQKLEFSVGFSVDNVLLFNHDHFPLTLECNSTERKQSLLLPTKLAASVVTYSSVR